MAVEYDNNGNIRMKTQWSLVENPPPRGILENLPALKLERLP